MDETNTDSPDAVEEPILDREQRQRVEALSAARAVLDVRPNIFGGSHVPRNESIVEDLIDLSEYILNGAEYEDDDEADTEVKGKYDEPFPFTGEIPVGEIPLMSIFFPPPLRTVKDNPQA